MTSAPSDALPVCDCLTALHEHGTRGMYGWHHCTCAPCRAAESSYQARRRGAGIDWADAGPARDRLALLLESGLTIDAIADMCAVHASQLHALRNGRRGKPMSRIRATTLNALNAIRAKDVAAYELPAASKVSGDAARQKIRALHCLGWSVDALHAESGLAKSALRGLRDGDGTTDGFRLKVDALYLRLRGQQAPRASEVDRTRYDNAVARAVASGWDEYDLEEAA